MPKYDLNALARAVPRLYKGAQQHFAHDRWQVHEQLRRAGFLKMESRELSKLGKDDPILTRMVEQRRNLLNRFASDPRNQALSDTKFRFRYHRVVAEWYKRNDYLTSKDAKGLDIKGNPGGKPSHWEWFRRLESRYRAAVKHQIETQGRKSVSLKPADIVRLVGSPVKEGPRKDKGQVKAQKARARARGQAFKNRERAASGKQVTKVPLERLLEWQKTARSMIKSPGGSSNVQREWRSSLAQRIKMAKAEMEAGRAAVA